jgi:hypothetical protein
MRAFCSAWRIGAAVALAGLSVSGASGQAVPHLRGIGAVACRTVPPALDRANRHDCSPVGPVRDVMRNGDRVVLVSQ